MSYNEEVDSRIRKITSRWKNTDHKKMFGGVCHLLNGNMLCGVYKDYLILRLDEDDARKVLKKPFARPFDITGRPMKGWVMVEQKGFRIDEELRKWLGLCKKYVITLPPK
ncbi:MAG: TfoX/Sxy family protein [Nitrospiraceae bacterium]|nr:MAG: TfoX/Sxy family protein [Nitrospiraceae bacterium]